MAAEAIASGGRGQRSSEEDGDGDGEGNWRGNEVVYISSSLGLLGDGMVSVSGVRCPDRYYRQIAHA